MNQEEVVGTLLVQAEIDPGFTELGNLSPLISYYCSYQYNNNNNIFVLLHLSIFNIGVAIAPHEAQHHPVSMGPN